MGDSRGVAPAVERSVFARCAAEFVVRRGQHAQHSHEFGTLRLWPRVLDEGVKLRASVDCRIRRPLGRRGVLFVGKRPEGPRASHFARARGLLQCDLRRRRHRLQAPDSTDVGLSRRFAQATDHCAARTVRRKVAGSVNSRSSALFASRAPVLGSGAIIYSPLRTALFAKRGGGSAAASTAGIASAARQPTGALAPLRIGIVDRPGGRCSLSPQSDPGRFRLISWMVQRRSDGCPGQSKEGLPAP